MSNKIIIAAFLITVATRPALASDPVHAETKEEIEKALQINDSPRSGRIRGWGRGRGPAEIVNSDFSKTDAPPAEDDCPRTWAKILFDIDSAYVKYESRSVLDEYGRALTDKLANAVIRIEGHTDNTGSYKHNALLSRRRGHAVADYLVRNHGIERDRLEVIGYGETRPMVSNATAAGREQNRRVEFCRIR